MQWLCLGDTPEDWCCGLPLIEERALTTEERAQVTQRLHKHRRLGYSYLT
jgi:hypothetical protein